MKRPVRVGYAKLGRSMPLSLDRCGVNGGDAEMVPTLQLLAERHPDVTFVLIGRNSGENPADVGLSGNVVNPWISWRHPIRREINDAKLNHPNWSIAEHQRVHDILMKYAGPEFELLDGMVMWVGQHGTTNTPLPSLQKPGTLTKPYDWSELYCSFLQQGINRWRDVDPLNREEVLLNADPRNVVKYRDSKWPWRHPVLSQYDRIDSVKHERYGGSVNFNNFDDWPDVIPVWSADGRATIWQSTTRSVYSRLEISGLLPDTPFADTIKFNDSHEREHDFGIIFNETKREVALERSRRTILKNWVLPLQPGFVRGKWSATTQLQLNVKIDPVDVRDYFELLRTTRCTLTTPSSGSGWATAKPWECFAAGVVCFFHPAYDDQNHILGDAPHVLQEWLRVRRVEDLRERIAYMKAKPNFWREIVDLQHDHYVNAVKSPHYLHMIEERLGL